MENKNEQINFKRIPPQAYFCENEDIMLYDGITRKVIGKLTELTSDEKTKMTSEDLYYLNRHHGIQKSYSKV